MPLSNGATSVNMKKAFNSQTPSTTTAAASKNFLETKALYNMVKNEGFRSFNQRPPAGIATQRMSPRSSTMVPHINQNVTHQQKETYNMVTHVDSRNANIAQKTMNSS